MRKVSLLGSHGLLLAVVMTMMIGGNLDTATAFSTPATVAAHRLSQYVHTPLFMSIDQEPAKEDVKAESTSDGTPAAATTAVETTSKDEETAPYPLDVPSPILLASSMIIAIASTGT